MFIQSKEGRQYSFSVELSSKEIDDQTFSETLSFFDKSLHKEKNVKEINYSSNIDIPVDIFREGNNGLRAIVKFLKEEKKLTFSKIAKILDRDQRTIWSTYNNTITKNNTTQNSKKKKEKIDKQTKEKYKKESQKFSDEKIPKTINTSIFANRQFSILESAAMHLLKTYSVKETAQILGRNQMTIWTVKRRAELKLKQLENNKTKVKRTNK